MQPKTTANLMEELLQARRLADYLDNNGAQLLETTLPQELEKLMKEAGVSRGDIAVRSGLSRVYIYQIFSGQKTPSRDSLLRICFALSMDVQQISGLSRHTGYPDLYPRDRRDSVIIFAASRHKTLLELEEMLEQQQLRGLQK